MNVLWKFVILTVVLPLMFGQGVVYFCAWSIFSYYFTRILIKHLPFDKKV